MYIDTTFPPPDRLHAVLSMARLLDPEQIGEAIDALIHRLDMADGDPDLDLDIADVPHDAEEDFGEEERGEGGSWPEAEGKHDTLHPIADDEREDDGRIERRPHRDRIRRTRCNYRYAGIAPHGWYEYTLREGSRRGGVVIG